MGNLTSKVASYAATIFLAPFDAISKGATTIFTMPPPTIPRPTTSCYYKKRYALEARKILLPIVGLSEDDLYKLDVTISAKHRRMTSRALQQRVKWGWQFLIDYMDDGRFAELRSKLWVRRRGDIVHIEKFDALQLIAEYKNQEITADELADAGVEGWQTGLVRFVDDAPEGESYNYQKFLSADKLAWLSAYLAPLTSLVVVEQLNQSGVRLVKNRVLAATVRMATQ